MPVENILFQPRRQFLCGIPLFLSKIPRFILEKSPKLRQNLSGKYLEEHSRCSSCRSLRSNGNRLMAIELSSSILNNNSRLLLLKKVHLSRKTFNSRKSKRTINLSTCLETIVWSYKYFETKTEVFSSDTLQSAKQQKVDRNP